MKRLQLVCALLLSVPLFGSAANPVLRLVEPPLEDGSAGSRMWEIIRGDGLMDWLAAGHLVLAILLLVPRTRFAAGFAQLPITVGIVAFNVTMFSPGVALALGMLIVNLGVVLRPADLRRLVAPAENDA